MQLTLFALISVDSCQRLYLRRPIRKITARSNSDTTLKHRNNENGNVNIINRPEKSVENISMHPDKLPSAETIEIKKRLKKALALNLRQSIEIQIVCIDIALTQICEKIQTARAITTFAMKFHP